MITRSANPINDLEVKNFLKSLSGEDLFSGDSPSPAGEYRDQFFKTFELWMGKKTHSKIIGADLWTKYITEGATGAFLNFDIKYREKQTYVLKGEYPFHGMCGAKVIGNIEEISSQGKFIISYPFSATGEVHPDMEEVLSFCEKKNIPVMVDCALLNISKVENFDINKYKCVEALTLSLSKSFSSGRFRTGVCFCREEWNQAPMAILNEWSYINHLNLNVHIRLMTNFGVDYVLNKYKPVQLEICNSLGVKESSCVLFGLSFDEKYKEFSRSGVINRLCLANLLEKHFT